MSLFQKHRRLYIRRNFRVQCDYTIQNKEELNMVKGLSRKVIIVKSPDPQIFEQAIFIVRDDYLSKQGIGQKELLRQARQAANGYVDRTYGWHRFRNIHPAVFTFLGAATIALIWAAVHFMS